MKSFSDINPSINVVTPEGQNCSTPQECRVFGHSVIKISPTLQVLLIDEKKSNFQIF